MNQTTEKEKRLNEILNDYANKHIAFRQVLDDEIKLFNKDSRSTFENQCNLFQILDSLDESMQKLFLELRKTALLPCD